MVRLAGRKDITLATRRSQLNAILYAIGRDADIMSQTNTTITGLLLLLYKAGPTSQYELRNHQNVN